LLTPYIGQFSDLLIFSSLKEHESPSHNKRRFSSSSPCPARYLIASLAWIVPITHGVVPSTGNTSFLKEVGKIQQRHGVFPGITVVAWPLYPETAL